MGELGLGRVPDFDGVGIVADQVFQVDRQGAAVALEAVAGGVDALGDVEDDGGEAVLVEVDFLVVGDFADRAKATKLVCLVCSETSAGLEHTSHQQSCQADRRRAPRQRGLSS
jgi:hypothetical protein